MNVATPDLSLDREAEAILRFVGNTWTPCGVLAGVIAEVRKAACHDARAFFDSMTIREQVLRLSHARRQALLACMPDGQASIANRHDAVVQYLFSLTTNVHCLEQAAKAITGQGNIYDWAEAMYEGLSRQMSELASIRPHGWEALAAHCGDDEDLLIAARHAYDVSADEALFDGATFERHSLPKALALPIVMYYEGEEGWSPAQSLVIAIYAHFVHCQAYLNTVAMLAAMEALPVADQELKLDRNINLDNPHLKALEAIAAPASTREAFEADLASHADFLALPEAERQAVQEENAKKSMALIREEMRKPYTGPGEVVTRTTNALIVSMRSIFGA